MEWIYGDRGDIKWHAGIIFQTLNYTRTNERTNVNFGDGKPYRTCHSEWLIYKLYYHWRRSHPCFVTYSIFNLLCDTTRATAIWFIINYVIPKNGIKTGDDDVNKWLRTKKRCAATAPQANRFCDNQRIIEMIRLFFDFVSEAFRATKKTHFEVIIFFIFSSDFHFGNYYACELRIFINIIIYFILRLLISNIWCGACLCVICIKYYKYVGIKFINEKHFCERARHQQTACSTCCLPPKNPNNILWQNEYEQQQRRRRQTPATTTEKRNNFLGASFYFSRQLKPRTRARANQKLNSIVSLSAI